MNHQTIRIFPMKTRDQMPGLLSKFALLYVQKPRKMAKLYISYMKTAGISMLVTVVLLTIYLTILFLFRFCTKVFNWFYAIGTNLAGHTFDPSTGILAAIVFFALGAFSALLISRGSFNRPFRLRSRGFRTKIRPLADRVLVKRLDTTEEQKIGGIIVPDTAKEKPQEAEVVLVGVGRHESGKRVRPTLKEGDKILIGKYSGMEIKLDGEEYLILYEDDILAVIK